MTTFATVIGPIPTSLETVAAIVAAVGFVVALRRSLAASPLLLRTVRLFGSAPRDGLGHAVPARSWCIRVGTHEVLIPRWHLGVVVVAFLVSPLVAAAVGVLLLARAVAAPRRTARRLQREWAANVPDLVELMRLALGSGCTIHLSLLLIAEHAGGAIGSMLERTVVALREGDSATEVLLSLQDRVGTPIRPLCAALLGSERYGLPVSATLEALAVEARLARRRNAELRSRRLPVLLIFPLVVCILPAFALLTVVPLLGGGLSSLSW